MRTSSPALSVLVATGRPRTRRALTALLDSEPGLRAAGVAGDLPAAIRLMRDRRPDVLLVDRTVLGPAGAGTLMMLTAASPDVAVYLVGMGDDPAMNAYARSAGAAGYLRLDETPERLSGALTSVA